MLTYPQIDPVAFSIGPLSVHWYGLAYLGAFIVATYIAKYFCQFKHSPLKKKDVDDLIFYGAIGVILGGRIGYVLFYNFDYFLHNPIWLFKVWTGGMSFHGGMLGVFVALWMYAQKKGLRFFQIGDFVAPIVPIGLGLGRIANFIGQELWGRETTHSFGMVFPNDPLGLVRHPSQLYEAFLEGLVLFAVLFWLARKQRPERMLSGVFLLGYGLSRFVVEFVREPDVHIMFDLMGWMTRGQILSLPMIAFGTYFIYQSLLANKASFARAKKT